MLYNQTMPTKKAPTPTVDEYLATLEHPLKPEVIALRAIILGADARIAEGIKWNVPSFRTSEYFATFHLRSAEKVQIILHLGAKVRGGDSSGIQVADPAALLDWLAKDRAAVTFRDLDEINAKRGAFEQLIRDWIKYV